MSSLGIRKQQHRRYLKEHKRATYFALLTSGKLKHYLADINKQAEKMFSRLVKGTAWIGRMNKIQAASRALVKAELIFD